MQCWTLIVHPDQPSVGLINFHKSKHQKLNFPWSSHQVGNKKKFNFFFQSTKILFAFKAFQHTTKFWFDQHWITVFSHTNNQAMIMNPNNRPANLQGSVPVSNNSPTLVWSCHQKTMWFSFGLGTFWGMFTSFYCELTVSSCFGN